MVIDFFDGNVVMASDTLYSEGGGQPSDSGMLITAENMVRVDDVRKVGDVIMHHVNGGTLRRGDRVKGIVD